MSKVQVRVWRYGEGALTAERKDVAVEHVLTLVVNGRELVSLLCSPEDLEELGVGYLFSEGLLRKSQELGSLRLDPDRGILRIWLKGADDILDLPFKRVITPGCGRGASLRTPLDLEAMEPVEGGLFLEPEIVLRLAAEFQRASELWRATHGVHACALCAAEGILVFRQDIGRHNALDKVLGHCFLKGLSTGDKILIVSGRISSEMMLKVARGRIPVVLSLSSATDKAIELADRLGITLIGSAKGRKFLVYSHPGRIEGGG